MTERTHDGECERLELPQSVPRGLLRHIIPRLLKNSDMSGTEIMQTLSEYTEGQWNPSPGTIYPLLSSLEEDGIIETVRIEGRSKTYRLTTEGRKEVMSFIKQKRGQVGHKTRLGPLIWEKVLDPEERVRFHLFGLIHSLDMLEGVAVHLKTKEQQLVKKELEEAQSRISSIIDDLDSGGE